MTVAKNLRILTVAESKLSKSWMASRKSVLCAL